jgi:tRNA A-37 threonylcarbamoyl transferase component Bud32
MREARQQIGPYDGAVAPAFRDVAFLDWLSALGRHVRAVESTAAQAGARVVALDAPWRGERLPLVVKCGRPLSRVATALARLRGASEARAWRIACHLVECGVPTPEPVAWLERHEAGRCVERYFITRRIEPVSTLRDVLKHHLWNDPDCGRIINLLETVAPVVRAMHDAGVLHGDLGNQNMLLQQDAAGAWQCAGPIDLSRAKIREKAPSLSARARDLSRLYLPTDLLRVFCEMYFGGRAPPAFRRTLHRARLRYRLHAWSRAIRHPIRHARVRRDPKRRQVYPAPRDIWIWDEKSAQPVSAWARRERNRLYPLINYVDIARAALAALPRALREYRALINGAFGAPRLLDGCWGISVEPREKSWAEERRWLPRAPGLPVLIRLYRHKGPAQWTFAAEAGRALARDGYRVSFAFCQDRRAVLEPRLWAEMWAHAMPLIGDFAEWIEVGHAVNRVKWGLWRLRDYRRLAEPIAEAAAAYPRVRWMGPAAIDFEYPKALAALAALPPLVRFDALSHHLYVDRRGAPENPQGVFAALEKFALARAIARASRRCEDRFIVSEVNWPLADTGVYSPVCSPYLYPGQRVGAPNVSEEDYARYLVRYLLQAVCSGLVERVYWWRLAARGFGLVDDGVTPWRERPAYRAWRHMLHVLSGAKFERNARVGEGAFVHVFRRPDGERLAVGYAWTPAGGPAHGLSCARAESVTGEPLDRMPERLTADPVYFRSLSAVD